MHRRSILSCALAGTALPWRASAQGDARVTRIGWLTAQRAPSLTPYVGAFRSALAGFGHVEGRNLAIEFRYGDDEIERVVPLAEELVRLPVDLIVAQGAAAFEIAKLNLKLPVVYAYSGDPVEAGLARSLAQPIGNMTGLTFMAAEFQGKRLELLREIVPRLRRVALVANPEHPGESNERALALDAGRRLGLALQYFATSTRSDLDAAFATMAAEPPQAVSIFCDGFAVQNRQRIIDFATAHRAPVISGWPVFADSGALCTYGPQLSDSYRRLAYYVDRVIKGARPADLPIEQPATFEMVVNLRAADALGVTVPPTVLLRADRVIR